MSYFDDILPTLIILGFVALILYLTNQQLNWWQHVQKGLGYFWRMIKRGAK